MDNRRWYYDQSWPLSGINATGEASPLPTPADPTTNGCAHPFSANPGDNTGGTALLTSIDAHQSFTVRLEYVHRQANVPYFAGRDGVTSPTGYTTTRSLLIGRQTL